MTAYNVGVKIGRFLRLALVIGIIGFLIAAAYGNGMRQAEAKAATPKNKIHHVAKKRVAKPEKIVINVYIENTEKFLANQSAERFNNEQASF